MRASWNFPKYNYGRRRGISSSGVETFKGDRYMHLAKEVCQNSLDAAVNPKKTVRVEFKKIELNKQSIPDYKRYEEVYKLCSDSNESEDKREREFFEYALKLLNKEKIIILRISDFNTTGLIGSDKDKNSPWQDLIKASGTSNKSSEAGGSFGIGKYAAFACSNLRTVFYDTYDQAGITASQGVVEISNFIDKDGIEKDGEGYFGIGEKNKPINKHLSFDSKFDRGTEVGTDIYILGFIEKENWTESMVYSIVDSFLLSIYSNKLEVVVEDITINKKSLEKIVTEHITYKGSNMTKTPLEFYKVLTSKDTKITVHKLKGQDGNNLGKFKLMLLVDKNLTTRRILMSRINGMKIFEQARFPRNIPFSGICILKDNKINEFFRRMETPEHDAWKADQFSEDPSEIKKADETRLSLIRKIREELIGMAKVITLDESDVEGLGNYLPDLTDDFLGKENKVENIKSKSNKTDIEISIINIEAEKRISETEIETSATGEYGVPEDTNVFPDGESKRKKKSKEKKPRPTEGNGKYTLKARKLDEMGNVRIFKVDYKDNIYRLIFNSEYIGENVSFSLKALGEDDRTKENIKVELAYSVEDEKLLNVSDGKIEFGNINIGDNIVIDFIPEMEEELSMEVMLYDY